MKETKDRNEMEDEKMNKMRETGDGSQSQNDSEVKINLIQLAMHEYASILIHQLNKTKTSIGRKSVVRTFSAS